MKTIKIPKALLNAFKAQHADLQADPEVLANLKNATSMIGKATVLPIEDIFLVCLAKLKRFPDMGTLMTGFGMYLFLLDNPEVEMVEEEDVEPLRKVVRLPKSFLEKRNALQERNADWMKNTNFPIVTVLAKLTGLDICIKTLSEVAMKEPGHPGDFAAAALLELLNQHSGYEVIFEA